MKTQVKKVSLLSKGITNAKTSKNEIETYIMYLAPADMVQGVNLCPFASLGCKASCLYTAGRGAFNYVQQARINKTIIWKENREYFYQLLGSELSKIESKAIKENKQIAVRLNGTSDIDHLSLLLRYTNKNWLESKNLVFYDYTKNFNTIKKYLNTNYHLTFSLSESNKETALEVLKLGGNVAVVFYQSLPQVWQGYKVINGDASDLRVNDEKNVIVGLIAKGKAKKDNSGFVIQTPNNN